MFRKLILPKEAYLGFDCTSSKFLVTSAEHTVLKSTSENIVKCIKERSEFAQTLFPQFSSLELIGVLGNWIRPTELNLHIGHIVTVHLPPSVKFGPIPKIPRNQIGILEGIFELEIPIFDLRTLIKLKQKSAILSVRDCALAFLQNEKGEDLFSQQVSQKLLRIIKLIDSWFPNSAQVEARFQGVYSTISTNFDCHEMYEFNSVPSYFARNGIPNITNLENTEFNSLISLSEYDFPYPPIETKPSPIISNILS